MPSVAEKVYRLQRAANFRDLGEHLPMEIYSMIRDFNRGPHTDDEMEDFLQYCRILESEVEKCQA